MQQIKTHDRTGRVYEYKRHQRVTQIRMNECEILTHKSFKYSITENIHNNNRIEHNIYLLNIRKKNGCL